MVASLWASRPRIGGDYANPHVGWLHSVSDLPRCCDLAGINGYIGMNDKEWDKKVDGNDGLGILWLVVLVLAILIGLNFLLLFANNDYDTTDTDRPKPAVTSYVPPEPGE